MLLSKVLGVIIIARNGDRFNYYQDPFTYAGSDTETTALGEAESHILGSILRNTYFDNKSPSYIEGIRSDLVDNSEVKVRVKAGVEGTVVFDSAIALLQGLFPPNPNNKIVLANESTIVAPLGGYQYVPVETVEPGNDRSLESWTNCPVFEKHTKAFYNSADFKAKAREAEPFFRYVKDYVFGRPTTLENMWNIYDFMNSELVHNKTYAYRLPPTLIEQARHWANYHETGVFSDEDINGIGNLAGRTILYTIISALERIAFNGDPLQFMLIETTYQSFVSLFRQTGITKMDPEIFGIPDFASALAIELRRGSPPDVRDFLRIKFKNGTRGFEDVHVFDHYADIPLTEFIYKAEGAAIKSNKQWLEVCGVPSRSSPMNFLGFQPESYIFQDHISQNYISQTYILGLAAIMLAIFGLVFKFFKNRRASQRRPKLLGEEVSQVVCNDYGSITHTRREDDVVHKAGNTFLGRVTIHRG